MRGWVITITIAIILNFLIIFPTITAKEHPKFFKLVQKLFSPTCHQLYNRSLCYFYKNNTIDSCILLPALEPKQIVVIDHTQNIVGYKFPVCSRCMAIYIGMLIMSLLFPIFYEADSQYIPKIWWLLISYIPIGIDGIGQLVGLWVSSNIVRIITGLVAAMVSTRYLIPILNKLLDKKLEND